MKAKITDFSIDYASGRQKLSVVFAEREDFRGQYDALHDRDIDIEISEHKERRSNNANKYLWEQINGKGSCLWASEIEEFPIAVTKERIG